MNIINKNLKNTNRFDNSLQLRNTMNNNARTTITLSPSQKYKNALINLREGLNEFKHLDNNNFRNSNNNNTFQVERLATLPHSIKKYNNLLTDNSQRNSFIRKNSEKNSSKKLNTYFPKAPGKPFNASISKPTSVFITDVFNSLAAFKALFIATSSIFSL